MMDEKRTRDKHEKCEERGEKKWNRKHKIKFIIKREAQQRVKKKNA